ncbi:MAG: 7-cyano-7-deazaguanine synthase [Candidatus Hodarchaeota archaeon]
MVSFNQNSENIVWGEMNVAYLKRIPQEARKIGLILLSGGLDSLITAAIAKKSHNWLLGMFFDYGQRGREIECQVALNLARKLDLHSFISANNAILKTTTEITAVPLLNSSRRLPYVKKEDLDNIEKLRATVEAVYIPFRQVSFYITLAAFAEAICKSTNVNKVIIYAGGHATDATTFPDESVEFTETVKQLLKSGALYGHIELDLPLLHQTKQQAVRRLRELQIESLIPFSCSCYSPIGITEEKPIHCGTCEACMKRKSSLEAARIEDTTIYRG